MIDPIPDVGSRAFATDRVPVPGSADRSFCEMKVILLKSVISPS
jgi:hypothetical protein